MVPVPARRVREGNTVLLRDHFTQHSGCAAQRSFKMGSRLQSMGATGFQTLPWVQTQIRHCCGVGKEKSGSLSLAAASPFQDRDREQGTMWWKWCLCSSPTPKSPLHPSTTEALALFGSEDACPPRTAPKHSLPTAAHGPWTSFPLGAGTQATRQVKGQETAPGGRRAKEAPGGTQGGSGVRVCTRRRQ